MGDVDAAGGAQSLGDGDHLLGRGWGVWRVVQPGGEAGRAFGQAFGQAGAHPLGFLVGRSTVHLAVQRLDPERHVADQRDCVHRAGIARQPVRVFAEAAEGPPALVAQQVQRRDRAPGHADGGQADAAIADDDGGDALADLAPHAGRAAQHGTVVVRVRVDEARRDGAALGQHLPVRAGGAKVAHGRDPVPSHAHVAPAARGAGAVEDGGVADNQVTAHR